MPRVSNPGLGGAGQQALLVSTVTLTAAQIIALSTTPIVIVPAPGANKIINLIGAAFLYNFGTRPFLPVESTGIGLFFSGDPGTFIVGPNIGIVDQSSSQFINTGAGFNSLMAVSPGVANSSVNVGSDGLYNQGPIVTTTLAAGGVGYAVNDTGIIGGGSADATYKVLTVDGGGAVLTYQITSPGTAYFPANNQPTSTGGAQPGVGVGFSVNVTAVATGNGSLKIVTYYQIIPVP